MNSPFVGELLAMQRQAVDELNAVDMFQPLARVRCRECEARIRIIESELRRNGWVPEPVELAA